MEEILHVAAIGTAGVAASVSAFVLGLYRVEFLMVVFFAVTFGGQFISAILMKMTPVESAASGSTLPE